MVRTSPLRFLPVLLFLPGLSEATCSFSNLPTWLTAANNNYGIVFDVQNLGLNDIRITGLDFLAKSGSGSTSRSLFLHYAEGSSHGYLGTAGRNMLDFSDFTNLGQFDFGAPATDSIVQVELQGMSMGHDIIVPAGATVAIYYHSLGRVGYNQGSSRKNSDLRISTGRGCILADTDAQAVNCSFTPRIGAMRLHYQVCNTPQGAPDVYPTVVDENIAPHYLPAVDELPMPAWQAPRSNYALVVEVTAKGQDLALSSLYFKPLARGTTTIYAYAPSGDFQAHLEDDGVGVRTTDRILVGRSASRAVAPSPNSSFVTSGIVFALRIPAYQTYTLVIHHTGGLDISGELQRENDYMRVAGVASCLMATQCDTTQTFGATVQLGYGICNTSSHYEVYSRKVGLQWKVDRTELNATYSAVGAGSAAVTTNMDLLHGECSDFLSDPWWASLRLARQMLVKKASFSIQGATMGQDLQLQVFDDAGNYTCVPMTNGEVECTPNNGPRLASWLELHGFGIAGASLPANVRLCALELYEHVAEDLYQTQFLATHQEVTSMSATAALQTTHLISRVQVESQVPEDFWKTYPAAVYIDGQLCADDFRIPLGSLANAVCKTPLRGETVEVRADNVPDSITSSGAWWFTRVDVFGPWSATGVVDRIQGACTMTTTALPTVTLGDHEEDEGMGWLIVVVVGVALIINIVLGIFCYFRMKARRRPVHVGGAAVSPDPVVVPPKFSGKVQTMEEEPMALPRAHSLEVPSYWANKSSDENHIFDQMVYVNPDAYSAFEELMATSYRPISTQDRPCPKRVGTCAKTPGGCGCVKPGGDPGLPTGYIVRRVVRVEDAVMWEKYLNRRSSIQGKRSQEAMPKFDPPVFTEEVALKHGDKLQPLDRSVNEVYLWHGTHVRTALSIAQNDFNIDLAGSSAGTMYGRGTYLAESSTKADEYARDEPGGYYDGIYAMILARVCLGKFYYTKEREPEAGTKVLSGEFDSTCGDRMASVQTFREYVIYDVDQSYPEFVVLYQRILSKDDGAAMRAQAKATPLHLQLPVYWLNCHREPFKDPFKVHYLVKKSTIRLLQRLVDGCLGDTGGQKAVVVNARRVEDSAMWGAFVEFKRRVAHRADKCIPVHALDGDPERGHVLTQTLMEDLNAESAISTEHLDEHVNEMLLWHGTSKEAAEAISDVGFKIARSGTTKHGRRFGEGAYLAEDLKKSLSYAPKVGDHIRYVLLCRTICGDMYYTEASSEGNAHEKAVLGKKDSVLANPGKAGPREFVVLHEAQVYPEFILELQYDG